MVVRNLKHSLMNAGPVSSGELAVNQNEGSHGNGSSTPRKRTKVAVLISGTGELFWGERWIVDFFSSIR